VNTKVSRKRQRRLIVRFAGIDYRSSGVSDEHEGAAWTVAVLAVSSERRIGATRLNFTEVSGMETLRCGDGICR
jgi:hypothetical protein